MTHKVVLALPAYNEGENLRPLIIAAVETFTTNGLTYHILVVNDGSTDDTGPVLQQLAQEFSIQVVTHPQNRGLGAAIVTCITESLKLVEEQDAVVCMDADNTHDPGYIPGMLDKLWNGDFDVVIASRFREGSKETGVPFARRVLSRGARVLFRIVLRLPDVRDYTCGYRAYRASLLKAAVDKYGTGLITRSGFACTDELLVKLSTISQRFTEVPFVLRYDKKRGESKLPLASTIWETLKMLVLHR